MTTPGGTSDDGAHVGRLERLERLYDEVRHLPEGERTAFLDEHCADDRALRAELESLLADATEAEAFIEALGRWDPDQSSRAIAGRLDAALEGRYRIEREIGRGGMATVFLARDIRHERQVALKVLKPELAAVIGAERFLAEIRTTARLQHPHILPLHDSGEADGLLFFVAPFVEGESLRARLERESQLPVEDAIRIATEVADALDYAHRQGVVHRDVKPGNILLHEGRALVADFGIALAVDAAGGERLTETGLSLGTPHYMSPEQATGEPYVGPTTDIYALGCVLYEMLVGEPPHTGGTAQAILGKIIMGEPEPVTAHRRSVPANVDAAVRKALEKLPADRFATAGTFGRALADPAFRYGQPSGVAHAHRRAAAWSPLSVSMTVIASGLTIALAWVALGPEGPRPVVRSSLTFREGEVSLADVRFAISPDGSEVVYTGPAGLMRRRLDDLLAAPIPGTGAASHPAYSPDGASVAFTTSGGSLRTVSLLGGPPATVVEAGVLGGGVDWGSDGMLYFTGEGAAIHRVPALGGDPEPITVAEPGIRHLWPDLLPGGQGLLFTLWRAGGPTRSEIAIFSFEEGEAHTLVPGAMGRYTVSGHLVYAAANGALLGAPIDFDRLDLAGPSVALADTVRVTYTSWAAFAVSATGRLVYAPGGDATTDLVPTWVERDGTAEAIDPELRIRATPASASLALSPDGEKLALSALGAEGTYDVWVKELDRGPFLRVTRRGSVNRRPKWSPDGLWLTFNSNRAGDFDLWEQRADGSGTAEVVLDLEEPVVEGVYSPGREWLVFRQGGLGISAADIYSLRPDAAESVKPLLDTDVNEYNPTISPDGRWLAYVSDRSGRDEVVVSPFPDAGTGRQVQVSTAGGRAPVWAHSGRELFYRSDADEMVAVQLSFEPSFVAGEQEVLFSVADYLPGNGHQQYDVTRDDQRFVMLRIDDVHTPVAELILVQSFFEELERRLPGS